MGSDARPAASPEWMVARTFVAAILLGTALLMTPWAHRDGRWGGAVDSLFTATSATCVTGLSAVDTATYSLAGQLVVLALIQAGGLGLMTFGTFLLAIAGRRMGLSEESAMLRVLGLGRTAGLGVVLKKTVIFTLLIEAAGAAILARRLVHVYGYDWGRAAYSGLFHSVSAFCNAGFSLYSDSLVGFRSDPVILLTVAALLILGGIGFVVMHDVTAIRFWKKRTLRGRLSLHTKIVVASSAVLIAVAWAVFAAFEWRGTLAGLGWPGKLLASFFQAVTPRTAGFNVVDMGALAPPSFFMTMAMMFVGGSPCSTAGGVKTTTLVVLILTVVTMVKGRRDTSLYERTMPESAVREAVSIFMLGALCVFFFFGVLLVTERAKAAGPGLSGSDALLFEVVSAFGTVGLSTGITPSLSALGKLCLCACMFIGRLGPLSLASFIGSKGVRQLVRYPEEDVIVG